MARMIDPLKGVSERVNALEAALAAASASLDRRLEDEATQRKEALFRQEHRLAGALWNVYDNWGNGRLFWASVCGFAGALIARMAIATAVGGGLAAGLVASLLALQANYLLRVQNEKMDIQTFVMDAQRRSQLFQAEFSAIATDVSAWIDIDKQAAKRQAKTEYELGLKRCAEEAKRIPEVATEDTYFLLMRLHGTSGVSVFEQAQAILAIAEKLDDVGTVSATSAANGCRKVIGDYQAKTTGLLAVDQFPPDGSYVLSPALASRIAALSTSLRPYPVLEERYRIASRGELPPLSRLNTWLFEGADKGEAIPEAHLIRQKLSTERAQLYLFLANQQVAFGEVLKAGADFSKTNLSMRVLSNMQIRDMPGSSLSSTMLTQVLFAGNLDGVDFHCADVRHSVFAAASLVGADSSASTFTQSRIHLTAFAFDGLSKARFEKVQVTGVLQGLMQDEAIMKLDDLILAGWPTVPKPARTTYGDNVVVIRSGAIYYLDDRRTKDGVPRSACPERPDEIIYPR